MSSYSEESPLSNHTIQTLKEIVEAEGKELSKKAIDSIQSSCRHALDSLNHVYFENPKSISNLILAFENLSERDRNRVFENLKWKYEESYEKEIRQIHKDYHYAMAEMAGHPFSEESVNSAMEWRATCNEVFSEEETFKEAFYSAIKGEFWIGESKGDKPKSTKKVAREDLFLMLYETYSEKIGLSPASTEQGPFWRFVETVITDPSMEKAFDGKSISDHIKETKRQYERSKERNSIITEIQALRSAIRVLTEGAFTERQAGIFKKLIRDGFSARDLYDFLQERLRQYENKLQELNQ